MQQYLSALLRHARRGSLIPAVRRKLGMRPRDPLSRYNAQTESDAVKVLAQLAASARGQGAKVLVVGPDSSFRNEVVASLQGAGIEQVAIEPKQVGALDAATLKGVACILLAVTDSKTQLELARQLVARSDTADIPLEYVALPRLENAPVREWDRYWNEDFVSPHLATQGDALYRIYRESLQRFTQKTDIRDFLDLCQLIHSVGARAIAGNLAEFGSFKGHSGYLTSRVMEHFGSSKTLYMFDMFENFPDEGVGVDRFWSGTHKVNFEQVKSKFKDRPNVRLVKGDFTRTLAETDTGALALAFIDCDSYRATKHLLEDLWDGRLAPGGIVAMEDYGHAALLGNRVAVHDFFDARRDAYTYFSQFSGFFVAVKLGAATAK